MGATGSKLEKALGDQFPEGERYFGLENFGNTCYCNSVLQVSVFFFFYFFSRFIYFSPPFHLFLDDDDDENIGFCLVLIDLLVRYPVCSNLIHF